MADSKLTALSELSVAALEDLLYSVDDPGGTPVSNKLSATRFLGQGGFIPGGRLTLTSATPVTLTDVTGAGTLYYALYEHNRIRIYDGTRWRYYTFSELSLALTITSGKNYDVFVYDNSGTLTLELSAAWTDDTTRADALTRQDGVFVKSGATTRLWLGTIRASGTNTTEDSGGGSTTQVGGKRFVWNAYNRVFRSADVKDTTNSWTYSTTTFQQANAAAGNKIEYVCGAVAESVIALCTHAGQTSNVGALNMACAVGIDSVSAYSGHPGFGVGSATNIPAMSAFYFGQPGLGYHYVAWLEAGSDTGTTTWYGDAGDTRMQSGLTAAMRC